jgi:hypothetical protein
MATKKYLTKASNSLTPMILGLTTNSKHPVSTAIAAHIKALEVQPS